MGESLCWVSVCGGIASLGSGRYAAQAEAIDALQAQTRENAKGRTFYLMEIIGEYVPETTMVKVG